MSSSGVVFWQLGMMMYDAKADFNHADSFHSHDERSQEFPLSGGRPFWFFKRSPLKAAFLAPVPIASLIVKSAEGEINYDDAQGDSAWLPFSFIINELSQVYALWGNSILPRDTMLIFPKRQAFKRSTGSKLWW